ncbi:hypothetical protein F5Y16DRAFT_178670 [Xylariaceae sp. FL0255]|nr:hypothetical protein F5Y16DRAFT_178670 [Xylariaceae sp. FL0255]
MLSTSGPRLTAKQERAFEAAQWILNSENDRNGSPASLRVAADRFGISKMSVSRQLQAIKNGTTNAEKKKPGRPQNITDAEQQILSFHFMMLHREDPRRLNLKVARDALNVILALRNSPASPAHFSDSWLKKVIQSSKRRLLHEAAFRTSTNNNQPEGLENIDIDSIDESPSENGGYSEAPSFLANPVTSLAGSDTQRVSAQDSILGSNAISGAQANAGAAKTQNTTESATPTAFTAASFMAETFPRPHKPS